MQQLVEKKSYRNYLLSPSTMGIRIPTLALLLLLGVAYGAERPKIPAPGPDLKLTGGLSLEQFFGARTKDSNCQAELSEKRDRYKKAKALLKDLVKKGSGASAIDAQEEVTQNSRSELLVVMEKCGECATQEVERRTVYYMGKTEKWYISDGSCYLPGTFAGKNYRNAVADLMDTPNYPSHLGGFPAILTFQGVDHSNGNYLPQGPVEGAPYYAFIGVQGPSLFGVTSAFSYYFRNDISRVNLASGEGFMIRFESDKAPQAFKAPTNYVTSASGKKTGVMNKTLTTVQGMWFVTEDGYFRYYTAADFGVSLSLAADFARTTLLDTVLTLSEKSQGE